jgi:sugar transferase (PEP-CTERM/EpsH1 system associated)
MATGSLFATLIVTTESQSLKVLVVSHRIPFPPNKGEKLRTFHQLEHLSNIGHSISLLAPLHDASDQQHADALAAAINCKVTATHLGNKYLRFAKALLQGRSMSEANFYAARLNKLIEQEVEVFAPDVILISASSLVKYIASDTAAKYEIPVLTDFMDVDSNKWEQYADKASFPMRLVYARESKLVKKLEQRAAEVSTECYLIAAAEVSLFKNEVSDKGNIQVLANGIDSLTFKANDKARNADEPNFLFTGVMDYKPNIDAVMWFIEHCWPEILAYKPKARFIIAGMNPTPAVQKLANENIQVTGFVEDIMPYFQSADVFVAPFQIARGVQNKVLQAMSCEIPVVSTSRGIEGIVHENGEDVLIADDPQDFTQHCLLLLQNSALRNKLGESARNTITQNYAWPQVLKPLTERLELLI